MSREATRRLHVFNNYTYYVWLRTPRKVLHVPGRFLESRDEVP